VRFPCDPDTLLALAAFERDAGDLGEARRYAHELAVLEPDDAGIADMVRQLGR
jgi:hypothetical protein